MQLLTPFPAARRAIARPAGRPVLLASPDQGFVVVERNGRWGQAIAVPGMVALGMAGVAPMSARCRATSAGTCAAGGYYWPPRSAGVRDRRAERPLGHRDRGARPGGPEQEGDAAVSSVSCASAGSCVAGGYYHGSHGDLRAFVAVERNGRWGTATGVPGLAALNKGGAPPMVLSVSCAPAGSCVAGGFYTDRFHHRQGFVTGEDNGRWGTPIPLPGLAALNTRGDAAVTSLSCASAGTCTAGGYYTNRSGYRQGFVTQAR